MVTELKECRICKSKDLNTVLDLGNIYPSGFIKDDEKVSEDSKAPLVLCQCVECGLVQLKHTVDLDLMYRQYWYASSLNKSMVSSLKDIADEIEERVFIDDNDLLVDIGCNDGTLLNLYTKGIKLGFDPALNLPTPKHYFINDYFSKESYNSCSYNKAKVITAIAMFYDLPDPNRFVQDVVSVLDGDGIFVIQFTDLLSMFKLTAFDNICHEHLEYYSLGVTRRLLEDNGLKLIDVSYNNVNGGSIRITAAHQDSKFEVSENVALALEQEAVYFKLENGHTFEWFNDNINRAKMKLKGFLKWAKAQNKTTYLLGASTKGNTLLQVCNITDELIPYAAEVNKDKFGLRTTGSDIKIISEEDALIKHPDYLFIPVWHFIDNLLEKPRIKNYLDSGGSLVVPLPEFAIYTKNGKFIL